MDISFRCDFEHELDWICSWHVQKPLNLSFNQSIYKVFGSRARKVCMPCFEYTRTMKKFRHVTSREVCGSRPPARVDRAMTWEELDKWMKGAVDYSKNPESEYLKTPLLFQFIYWLVIPGLSQLHLLW
jgi:hypothetical protein